MPYLEIQVAEISGLSTNINDLVWTSNTYDEPNMTSLLFVNGTKTDVVIDQKEINYSGSYWTSYADLFYNRIYIIPSTLDFTGVVDNSSISWSIWNAFLVSKTLSSLTSTNLAGINLSGTTSGTFNALESKTYTSTVTSNADAIIDGYYTITFSGISAITLPVAGTRAALWVFEHNYASPAKEVYEYLTDVQEVHSGKEKRFALRTYPRRSLEFDSIIFKKTTQDTVNDEAARARAFYHNFFSKWQGKIFLLPIWTDYSATKEDYAVGTTVIETDTRYLDYRIDGLVLLWDAYDNYEVCKIINMSDMALTITSTQKAWKAGTTIAPTRKAFVSEEIFNGTRLNEKLETVTNNWILLGDENQYQPRKTNYTQVTYSGYELYMPTFNSSGDENVEMYKPLRVLDNQTGYVLSDLRFPYSKERFSCNMSFKTREELSNFLGFLNYRQGRLKPFWMPTFSNDLQLTENFTSGSTQITIKNIGYTLYGKEQIGKRDIILIKNDGTYICRRISTSVVNVDGTETITLTSTIPYAASPSDFRYICFLKLLRLETDRIEIIFGNTSNDINTSFNLIEVSDSR